MKVEFGDWLPDQAPLESPGNALSQNVYPTARGYIGVAGLLNSGLAISGTCIGAASFVDDLGTAHDFAGSTSTLYKESGGSFTSVGGSYTSTTTDFWEFINFNNTVLACNNSATAGAEIQSFALASASAFSDVGGSAPHARHLAVVGDFVVAGNTYDSVDGIVARRVRWCAINDHTSWTVSATTQADYTDLQGNGGAIQRITGGEYGLIFQERAVWRMTYVGSPKVFQLDEILPGIGTPSPQSVAQHGDLVFFWSEDGFRVIINGSKVEKIGSEKVDRYMRDFLLESQKERIVSIIDPTNNRVLWGVPGSEAQFTRFLCYAWDLGKWSTLLESLLGNYLSRYIVSNVPKVGVWTGATLQTLGDATFYYTATIYTKELDAGEGRRFQINRIRVLVEGIDAGTAVTSVTVATRDNLEELNLAATAYTLHIPTNSFTGRSVGRYITIRVVGNTTYQGKHWLGVDIDKTVLRGLR